MPPELPRTLWQWASLLWHFSEEEIIRFVGADAYIFLRFLRMGFKVRRLGTPPQASQRLDCCS